jgi:hypothetical protein
MTETTVPDPGAALRAGGPARFDEVLGTIPSDGARPDENADESIDENIEAIARPAKVMRIGAMIKQLLDEVRGAELDPASRTRLKEIYEHSVRELAGTLSPDLAEELDRLVLPFDSDQPSAAELRVAQAQLVGWLEGLFHGIQATIFAQQMAAQAQLQQMRRSSLPAGAIPAEEGDERRRAAGPYL